MSPIILIGLGAVVFGLGVGLGLGIAYFQRVRDTAKASDIQNELDEYRRHVNEHFSQTAQHFQSLGQQYQSLYEHMAEGAQALCDPAQSDALPGFAAGSAPALAVTDEEVSSAPDVVKDYAPTEESELEQVEPHKEPVAPEPLTEISASTETLVEPAANDSEAEQVAPEIAAESERTVH